MAQTAKTPRLESDSAARSAKSKTPEPFPIQSGRKTLLQLSAIILRRLIAKKPRGPKARQVLAIEEKGGKLSRMASKKNSETAGRRPSSLAGTYPVSPSCQDLISPPGGGCESTTEMGASIVGPRPPSLPMLRYPPPRIGITSGLNCAIGLMPFSELWRSQPVAISAHTISAHPCKAAKPSDDARPSVARLSLRRSFHARRRRG